MEDTILSDIGSFFTKVRASGGSIELTVDRNVVEFEGLQPGDLVKVLIRKIPKKE